MKKLELTYCTLCALLLPVSHYAQTRDTVLLHEVSVVDYRSKSVNENFAQNKVDSTTRSIFSGSSVSQMLLQQNTCFVKSYGPANIAALSIRGSTAQQTAVVWNGMNINNPMLGQADVSLLPVGFFNDISLQKGALSGYWGSGAMAGVLNLRSDAGNNSPLTVRASTSYSSLENIVKWASVNFSAGRWGSATRVLLDDSKNRYNYFSNDSTVVKQAHAETRQRAIMQDVSYKVNARQQIGVHIWWQDAQRQVPYTLSEVKQDADQYDGIFRTMADWKISGKKYTLNAKAAFFNEALNYDNTTYLLHSRSKFRTEVADIDGQYFLPRGFVISGGITNSISTATSITEGSSEGYLGEKQLSRTALYENISWKNSFFQASAYGREEYFNFKTFVPTVGATTSLSFFKWLSWKTNAGTIYRYPTLNDLYWNPGGNPNLKPEQGYSAETSLQTNYTLSKLSLMVTGTIFTRNIHNFIVWLPGKDGNPSPQNVLQVWSRGGETNTELVFKNKLIRTSMQVITNYILSTRTQTDLVNDGSLNRQMPYVPMYSGSAIYSFEIKGWMLRVAYVYTGYRYLTSDNYSYLLPYSLLDARLSKTFQLKNFLLNVFAEGNNLMNENYQSYTQYAMPLRNYKAGIILQYQKPVNKNN